MVKPPKVELLLELLNFVLKSAMSLLPALSIFSVLDVKGFITGLFSTSSRLLIETYNKMGDELVINIVKTIDSYIPLVYHCPHIPMVYDDRHLQHSYQNILDSILHVY